MMRSSVGNDANQVMGEDRYDPLGLSYQNSNVTKIAGAKRSISASKKRKRSKSGKKQQRPDVSKINHDSA